MVSICFYTFNTTTMINYISKHASLNSLKESYAKKNNRQNVYTHVPDNPRTIDKKGQNKLQEPSIQDIFFIHFKTKVTCISLIRLYALLGI